MLCPRCKNGVMSWIKTQLTENTALILDKEFAIYTSFRNANRTPASKMELSNEKDNGVSFAQILKALLMDKKITLRQVCQARGK